MPLTTEEIRKMIVEKTAEIQASRTHTCRDCGEKLDGSRSKCEGCERKATVEHLRRLAETDARYLPVLEAATAEDPK